MVYVYRALYPVVWFAILLFCLGQVQITLILLCACDTSSSRLLVSRRNVTNSSASVSPCVYTDITQPRLWNSMVFFCFCRKRNYVPNYSDYLSDPVKLFFYSLLPWLSVSFSFKRILLPVETFSSNKHFTFLFLSAMKTKPAIRR